MSTKTSPTAPQGRRARLRELRALAAHGEVALADACTLLHASPASVRRDFAFLAASEGYVRTWGGLRGPAAPPGGPMVPFDDRLQRAVPEKRAIAAAAAALLQPGDVVLVDGGTTTAQLAPHLAGMRVRIVTNSIGVAHRVETERRGRLGAEIHLTGGILIPDSHLLAGPGAVAALEAVAADWAFLSAAAFDARGASNDNALVVDTERAMLASARRVAVLCDAGKLGGRAMHASVPLRSIDVLVTDRAPRGALAAALRRARVRVIVVPVGSGRSRGAISLPHRGAAGTPHPPTGR